MRKQYRQGDVLIERVERHPEELTPIKPDPSRGLVLAEGEATGHAHTIPRRALGSVGRNDAGDIYFYLEKSAPASHQEHDPIPLEPGLHRSMRQREYSPEEIRNVAD